MEASSSSTRWLQNACDKQGVDQGDLKAVANSRKSDNYRFKFGGSFGVTRPRLHPLWPP